MLGKTLQLFRILSKQTAKEMAEKLGISRTYLSEIENEHREPTLKLITRCAEIFHVNRSTIFLMEELMESEKDSTKLEESIISSMKRC